MEEILIKSLAASSRKSGGVEVSATDKREYRLVTLENGVVCLIISDVEADQCACACSVDVGSFADPADALGLAHFLEHLLFLGSEKYPLPNETERHLTMNGGESNAYTDDEQTNYHFDVLPAGFDEALDRFAQFFVAPTFEPSMTARELMAVDSEMQQNKQSDSWRLHRVLQSQASAAHPWSRCTDGCLRTLRDDPKAKGYDVLAALRAFYDAHYTARAMKLVISGTQPLDTLESWARRSFSAIRARAARPAPTPAERAPPPPAVWPNLPERLYVCPVKSLRFVELIFPMAPLDAHWREQPDDYLADLVGHESPGSILYALKKAGLATNLSAGAGFEHKEWSAFKITVSLSPRGLERVDSVVECVLCYVALVMRADDATAQRLWYEGALLCAMRFRFAGCSSFEPIDRVSNIAADMQTTRGHIPSPAHVLSFRRRMAHDGALNKRFCAALRPDNMLLAIVARRDEWPADACLAERREEFYGVVHARASGAAVAAAAAATRAQWRAVVDGARSPEWSDELRLPPPNAFVPDVGAAVGADGECERARAAAATAAAAKEGTLPWHVAPVRVAVPGGTLWHKRDTTFGEPKTNLLVRVLLPPCVWTSTERRVYLDLLLALVVDDLDSLTCVAREAVRVVVRALQWPRAAPRSLAHSLTRSLARPLGPAIRQISRGSSTLSASAGGASASKCGASERTRTRSSRLCCARSSPPSRRAWRSGSESGSALSAATGALRKVSVLLCTVTFYANLAHSLTRSP